MERDLSSLILESVIGTVIAWLVPKALDALLAETKREIEAVVVEKGLPWVRWCVAHLFGGAVGGFLSGALGVMRVGTPGGLANWTAFGASLGVAQWLVLRRGWEVGPLWAAFSALGWSTSAYFEAAGMGAAGWFAAGLAVGVLQFLLIRKTHAKASWWIAANLLGWPIAGWIGIASGMALSVARVSPPMAWVLEWGIVGLAGSLALGFALQHMPRTPSPLKLSTPT